MHHVAALPWQELDDYVEARDLAVALEARPDDHAVEKDGPDAWATAGPRCDPLLAPRRDGVEFVGSSGQTNGWDASTSAKTESVLAGGRTRGDIGLGGCAGNIAREGLAVPPKPPPNSVSAVFPKLPP